MPRRILVPLDGSATAVQSLQVAARLARSNGASLVLLRVVPAPAGSGLAAAGVDLWAPAAAPHDRLVALDYLRNLAAVQQLAGIDVQVHVAAGPAAPAIVAAARACRADLIVLCRSTHYGPDYWMCGDVAREVVRVAQVPVLVLRSDNEEATLALLRGRQSRRVVIALDGSSAAEAAVEPAADLVAGLSALAAGAVYLIQVVAQPGCVLAARTYLRTVALRLLARRPGLVVSWSVEVDGDVAQRLTWIAQYGPDTEEDGTHPGVLRGWVDHDTATPAHIFSSPALIALSAFGTHGSHQGATGDIPEALLHSAPLPVLIVPSAHVPASISPRLLVRARPAPLGLIDSCREVADDFARGECPTPGPAISDEWLHESAFRLHRVIHILR